MKILVADDDRTMTVLLRATLAKLGHEVLVAGDGEAAWRLLQEPDAPKFAILDWMMPSMTGVEVCRKVRQRTDAPYVYILLLTAMDQLDDLVEGIEAGADAYITKPFNLKELQARLRAGKRILDLQSELLAAQAQLEILVSHDFLTGLWNRSAVLERLAQELARSQRERNPVGVILTDIDHFKRVNDTYGHARGDQVLQEVAKRMTETIRPYDSVGRYGGEEFLIVVADCDIQQTFGLAERIRHALSAAPMALTGGPSEVTASFGVSASHPGEDVDLKDLIEAADRALYRAKENGRNRVEWCALDEIARAGTEYGEIRP